MISQTFPGGGKLSGLVGLRKNQAVSVFAHVISICFVFTDVLTAVEEDHELDCP